MLCVLINVFKTKQLRNIPTWTIDQCYLYSKMDFMKNPIIIQYIR